MLCRLSFRNCKRQFSDYIFYVLTIVISVAVVFGFNSLIFSDIIKSLEQLEILPYMITLGSIIITVSLAWLVSYITNFMLKKRSKEFGLYMLMGIEDKRIAKLFIVENMLLGIVAFAIGILTGVFVSKIIEQIIWNLIGYKNNISLSVSFEALALTFLYMVIIFLMSFRKNIKLLKKMNLRDLLYYENESENLVNRNKSITCMIILLSIICLCSGFFFLIRMPLGKGADILVGICCIITFFLLIYNSIPQFLANLLGEKIQWKYDKENLMTFRLFTSKFNSIKSIVSILSILFTLTIMALGTTAILQKIINKSIEESVFDIVILQQSEDSSISSFERLLNETTDVRASFDYNIYTSTNREIKKLCNKELQKWNPSFFNIFQEFEYDTYMRYSDYKKLCEIFSVEVSELENNEFIIHSVPVLEEGIRQGVGNESLKINGRKYNLKKIDTWPLGQSTPYQNGLYYIVVVPDNIIEDLKFLYRLNVFMTEEQLTTNQLNRIIRQDEALELLNQNSMISGEGKKGTLLSDMNMNYVMGKWALRENYFQIYTIMVVFVYISLIFEIIGLAVLATQLLSNVKQHKHIYELLGYMGMEERNINNLIRKQLGCLFTVPIILAFVIAIALNMIFGQRLQISLNNFMFSGISWMIMPIVISLMLFLVIYILYFCILYRKYKKSCNL